MHASAWREILVGGFILNTATLVRRQSGRQMQTYAEQRGATRGASGEVRGISRNYLQRAFLIYT